MEFCEKLSKLRKSKNLTQEELTSILNTSRTAVSKWESGRGYPNLDAILSLSKIFETPVEQLLENEKEIVAEQKNNHSLKVFSIFFFLIDLFSLSLVFLPLTGTQYIPLIENSDLPKFFRIFQISLFSSLFIFSIFALTVCIRRKPVASKFCYIVSFIFYEK